MLVPRRQVTNSPFTGATVRHNAGRGPELGQPGPMYYLQVGTSSAAQRIINMRALAQLLNGTNTNTSPYFMCIGNNGLLAVPSFGAGADCSKTAWALTIWSDARHATYERVPNAMQYHTNTIRIQWDMSSVGLCEISAGRDSNNSSKK